MNNISRRDFFAILGAGAAATALPGCCLTKCGPKHARAKIALQLYSLCRYIAAKGSDKGVEKFDAILGRPGCDKDGKPCATPVDWDGLIPVSEADGVKWYVVECERHFDDLSAITPSYEFLKSKGLN